MTGQVRDMVGAWEQAYMGSEQALVDLTPVEEQGGKEQAQQVPDWLDVQEQVLADVGIDLVVALVVDYGIHRSQRRQVSVDRIR